MKYLKIFVLITAIAVVAYACKKSFLDKAPIGSLDPGSLANRNGVQGLLVGAYSMLDGEGDPNANYGPSGSWASSADNWIYGSVAGTESHKGSSVGDQPEIVPIETFHAGITNPDLEGKWDVTYDAIARCNDVIRGAAAATDISAADLPVILGQAKALRGWYHFEAKKIWNNIPFIDETVTYSANNYFVGNDVDTWPLIEADLQYAVSNLPTSFTDVGRINKYAAEAILAKIYMFENKLAQAQPLLEDIINSGKYSLEAHYHDNFDITKKNGTESVFAAQSSVNDGGGGNNANVGDVLNFPYGGSPGTCCGFNQPSQWFVDHFQVDATTGLPDLDNFDATHVKSDQGLTSAQAYTIGTAPLDPRVDWSAGRRGIPYLDWGPHAGADWIRAQTDGGPYSPIKNVYPNAVENKLTDASYWSSGVTGLNVNLIRYADVLLWDAEVEVEIGNPEVARANVNLIRARAADPSGFVMKYLDDAHPQSGFSNIPAANYKIGLYTTSWAGNQDLARKAVRFERYIELGMEGMRFFDLVRWGIANEEITRYLAKEQVLGISYLSGATFTPGKTEYYPLPQNEIDKSGGKLKQNPGY